METEQEKQDKLYKLSDKDKPLNEDDVRIIVSQQLRNIIAPTVVQAGYLQSGNYVAGSAGWRLTPTGAEFQSITIAGVALTTKGSFGGDGSDGALEITSGTTTIDLGNAASITKNYSSISITGTGKLAFSNPHDNGTVVVLKSQGDVTLTSSEAPMIACNGLGAAGGASAVDSTAGGGTNGTAGNNGVCDISYWVTNKGNRGTLNTTDATAAAAATYTTSYDTTPQNNFNRYPFAYVGAGGASGSATAIAGGDVTSGAGSRGGGCLVIECGGAWNFTTANGISVAGTVGGNASTGSATQGLAGGGGGGGGGFCYVLYNDLTANTGSITVSGGNGGNGATVGSVASNRGLSGGGGGSYEVGTVVASSDGVASGGGGGGGGVSIVSQNTQFS